MKLILTNLVFALIILCFFGCGEDDIVQPPITITELSTNGTFVATSPTQIQGTMFITDQDGNPVNGLTGSNVRAELFWESDSPADTSCVEGAVVLVPYSQSNRIVAGAVTMDYSGSMGSAQIPPMLVLARNELD